MTDLEKEGGVGIDVSGDDHFWGQIASGSTIATEEDWDRLMESEAESESKLEE